MRLRKLSGVFFMKIANIFYRSDVMCYNNDDNREIF